ncbi:MAG: hypothetical protein R2701_08750 [Acidimicrobiales bacterium]
MHGGLWRRTWRHDRLALAVLGVGSLIATIAYRAITRPMADTVTYRATAHVLRDGWPTITERGPGYPILLILTGSTSSSTHLLWFVQLGIHLLTAILVIDVARSAGVGRHGRAAIALLLIAPASWLRVVYEGTEILAALLVTLAFWLVLRRPDPRHRLRWALALGAISGAAGLVRPNLAMLFLPMAVVVWAQLRSDRPAAWRSAAAVALAAVVLIGGYSAINGIRFDSFGLTPLAPYHLNAKTAPYVEELPSLFEPARTILIEERDAALLRGESSAPDNYIWRARPRLEAATGLHGRELDRYVMRIDVELITNNPFAYLDTVKTASVNYTNLDSQPAILGLGRPAAWAQQAAHLVLLALFVATVGLVPGLALAGRVARRALEPYLVAVLLAATTMAGVVLTETGTARLRGPTEPVLALLLVLSASIVRRRGASDAAPLGASEPT